MKLEAGLMSGILKIDAPDELANLAGFASRSNAKRGFLFVSKVLGKHYPSKPSTMQEVCNRLAALIKPKLKSGPTIVIGFAETATGLGYGVYESLGLHHSYYQHTTRYNIDQPIIAEFKETHSHAPSHYLYYPKLAEHQDILNTVVNIVLVDDEFTTGNTLLNIISELKRKGIDGNFVGAGLLDWTQGTIADQIPIVSLLQGSYEYEVLAPPQSSNAVSEAQTKIVQSSISNHYGRLGCNRIDINLQNVIGDEGVVGEHILVLGTGEFMSVSYILGKQLEARGAHAFVQSTTRSPILIGNEIKSVIAFKDNYSENIDNFVYNIALRQYDRILICYETPNLPAEHNLYSQLLPLAPIVKQLFF